MTEKIRYKDLSGGLKLIIGLEIARYIISGITLLAGIIFILLE